MLTAIHRNPDQLLTSGMGYDADALSWWKSFSVKNCNCREHKHGETKNGTLVFHSCLQDHVRLEPSDANIGVVRRVPSRRPRDEGCFQTGYVAPTNNYL
jgi:hypothetical protein